MTDRIEPHLHLSDVAPCPRLLVGMGDDTYDPPCAYHAGHPGPCEPVNTDWSNFAASDAAKATLTALSERLIPPARLGAAAKPILGPVERVDISLYRSPLHDEEGVRAAQGTISNYDGELHWWTQPPEGILA